MYEYDFGHGCGSVQTDGDIEVAVPRQGLSNQRDEHRQDEHSDQAREPAYQSDAERTEEVLPVGVS